MEWVSTTGRMGQYIMENLKRDLSMEKGNGENSKMLKIAISMKVNIGVIRKMDICYRESKRLLTIIIALHLDDPDTQISAN